MASPASEESPPNNLVDIVKHWYPDALTRTYIVPPVHHNRVAYTQDKVPGTQQEVLVLPSGEQLVQQQGSLQADFAQQHVLRNLQEMADFRREVMFVVSELNFKDYLNKPFYAKQTGKLPKPGNLPKEQRHHGKQGDFDVLVIHRDRGILVGEIKSVGRTEASRAGSEVAKVVAKAVQQLDKCEVHARHMVSDLAPGLAVSKTLFLPYVSADQLRGVLENNAKLRQAVCKSLGAVDAAEAVQLCCCSEQLSPPASYWHVTPAVLSQLTTWWTHLMARTADTVLSDDLYLDIVARFVGPATTVSIPCINGVRVEVRTAGQAVAELGRRLALLVLTLQQVQLMNRDPPRVCITGPPETGKTVVLVLQGLRWLLQGHDVQVVSARYPTRAVCTMITEQLRTSLSAHPMASSSSTPGSVFLHHYDFFSGDAEMDRARTDLLSHVKHGALYVLLDEAEPMGRRVWQLVTELASTKRVPHLYLWATSLRRTNIPPDFRPVKFTVPLRSAPSVLRELMPAVSSARRRVVQYSDCGVPAPGDGPEVIRLSPHGHSHTAGWPVDCPQCGKEIAAQLRRLGVGCGESYDTNGPAPLSYRDVLITTRSVELQDDVIDDAGRVTSRASGFVRGLRAEGIPVCVLGIPDWVHNRERWERDVEDVAVARTDRVTAAICGYVQGLERRVVVTLPGVMQHADDGDSYDVIELRDRLMSASRCTTQLIAVDLPHPPQGFDSQGVSEEDNHSRRGRWWKCVVL